MYFFIPHLFSTLFNLSFHNIWPTLASYYPSYSVIVSVWWQCIRYYYRSSESYYRGFSDKNILSEQMYLLYLHAVSMYVVLLSSQLMQVILESRNTILILCIILFIESSINFILLCEIPTRSNAMAVAVCRILSQHPAKSELVSAKLSILEW